MHGVVQWVVINWSLMALVKSLSLSLTSVTVMGKLDGSAMTWKPPWVIYTSLGRFPPGELSIVLV